MDIHLEDNFVALIKEYHKALFAEPCNHELCLELAREVAARMAGKVEAAS